MAAKNNIGILTGGGDVPGLNPVIKSVVYRATEAGRQVIGIRKGWEGLTHMTGPDDPVYVRPLTRDNTRTIDRTGGTVLHTSRTNPRKMAEGKWPKHITAERIKSLPFNGKVYDFTPIVLENLDKLGISTLITIGGDDTLSFSAALSAAGMPVIAIPKTMDNDVQGTEYCIGFSTAITRAKELITRQRTTLGSHERIGIFRIFGRDAGFTALYTSYVTSTRCLIPEYPFDLDHVAEILAEDKKNNLSHYALVVVSEGATLERQHGCRIRRSRRLRPSQKDRRWPGAGRRSPQAHRQRNHDQRPDLRPAQRRTRRDRSDWWPSPSRTSPWKCCSTALPAAWSASRTAATRTRRYRRLRWAPARSTQGRVQHGALSPALCVKAGRAAAVQSSVSAIVERL